MISVFLEFSRHVNQPGVLGACTAKYVTYWANSAHLARRYLDLLECADCVDDISLAIWTLRPSNRDKRFLYIVIQTATYGHVYIQCIYIYTFMFIYVCVLYIIYIYICHIYYIYTIHSLSLPLFITILAYFSAVDVTDVTFLCFGGCFTVLHLTTVCTNTNRTWSLCRIWNSPGSVLSGSVAAQVSQSRSERQC